MENINTYGLKKYGECPSYRQMEWYSREKTAFFHFGMNTFNTFKISEMIELGHKIRGFKVSGLTEKGWLTLAECECMGYRWVEHFDTITVNNVKIEITESVDTPAIRSFAMYHFDEEIFKQDTVAWAKTNLLESNAAKIEINGDEILVNLGGIFPYNTIIFDGNGVLHYELYIFNGTSYELKTAGEGTGDKIKCEFDTVADSYSFKLKLYGDTENQNRNIEVYWE